MWGCFLMSGVKILHFLKDWWKSIPIHQNYTMALMRREWEELCWIKGECSIYRDRVNYSVLLWQKEASDLRSKSELLIFSYFTQCAPLPGQILCINTHLLLRDMLCKTSWYSIDVSGNVRHICTCQTSFCQSRVNHKCDYTAGCRKNWSINQSERKTEIQT